MTANTNYDPALKSADSIMLQCSALHYCTAHTKVQEE